jgi:hypothetical protein
LVEPGFAARVGERLWFAPDPARCIVFATDGARIETAGP